MTSSLQYAHNRIIFYFLTFLTQEQFVIFLRQFPFYETLPRNTSLNSIVTETQYTHKPSALYTFFIVLLFTLLWLSDVMDSCRFFRINSDSETVCVCVQMLSFLYLFTASNFYSLYNLIKNIGSITSINCIHTIVKNRISSIDDYWERI